MRIITYVLTIITLFQGLALAKTLPLKHNISGIKQFLRDRSEIPKLFIPDKGFAGQMLNVTVRAPGAIKARVLGSFVSEGIEGFDPELNLHLGTQYDDWGTQELNTENGQAEFAIKVSADASKINQPYFVEAIVTYPGKYMDLEKTAYAYGGDGNINETRHFWVVAPPKKDGVGQFDLARSLFPGLRPTGGLK